MDRCLLQLRCAVAAFVFFAGSAAADNTPPQLVSFSISPLSVDTSAGPATLNISISAQDNSNGFGSNAAGNGSISLALQSGNTIFSRQSLPVTGGTLTNPIFQFGFTLPQFSPSGAYSIGITLVDNASNTSIFNAASLQALGFPSAITVTNGAFGSITVSPSTANVPASGGSGSLSVTASNSGFAWSATSNAPWLTITSGAFGTGNATITYLAAVNNSSAPRTGIITVSGQTFTAIQAPASSALNTTAGSLQFIYQIGGAAPAPQTITAYSSGSPLNFTATASSGGNWLFVSPSNGVTSENLSVFVNPIGLVTGVYTGNVTVTANGSSNGSQTEAVTLTVGSGPMLTVTPLTLSFSYQQGSSPAPAQSLVVTAGAPTAFTASASSTGGWLAVVPLSSTTPSTLAVSISALTLAPGTYGGSVVISTPTATKIIPVTLVVAASSAVAVIPSSLTFSYAIGGAVPLSQSLLFSGGPARSTFAATASSAGNWLTIGGLAAPAPGGVSASVNPSGLAAGVYAGAITVTQAGVAQQNVPVTLIVAGGPGFAVSPNSLTFNAQSGVSSRSTQLLHITASDPNASFTATSADAQSWLVLSTAGPFQAGQLGVSVNSFNLVPGTYVGHITITGTNSSQVVPVTVVVTGVGSVTVSPASLQVNYQVGDPNPSTQPFFLSGSSTTFTASASSTANWLAVNPTSGSSPGTLSASLSPAGLAPGLYTGIIAIFPAGSAMQTITISLNVYAPQNLTLSPSALSFAAQVGGAAPASQVITVACAGSALSFRPAASSLGNWLSSSVPNALGNNQIIVSVNQAGLAANSYMGTITIFGVGACNTTQTVPVTLVVSGVSQSLTSTGNSLVFSYQAGGSIPAAQTVPIGCAGAVSPFTASSNSPWLHLSPSSGVTPASLNVSADPTGLAAGSYAGGIVIYLSGSCGGNQIVSVTLVVSSSAQPVIASGLTFSAASLVFTSSSATAAPPQQTVSLSCGGVAAQFLATATSNGSWLFVSPSGGTTPGTLAISVNPGGLAPGSYTGSISATANSCGAAPALPVTLTVIAPPAPITNPSLTITPGSLTFTYQAGGANPADQTLLLTVSGGVGLAFTATASSAGWLSVSPPSGAAPASLNVSVNPAGLLAGTYSGVVLISASTGAAGSSQNIAVSLTVSAAAPPPITNPVPIITLLVNGASLLPSPLSPGEIISFYGRGLGPTDSAAFLLTPTGMVENSLAGTRVIIDGTPAPMLYTQAGQVNAIVPFSVAGKSSVQVQLEYQGIRSAPASFVVADAAPAIFSIDGSGRGQGAILDQDTSVNSDLNPADRGSIVVLYASGAGQMVPATSDGAITGTDPAKPVALVSVLVDGQITEILYAGAAPGLVAGALQVNFRLPQQVRTGAAIGILLKVGRFTSQPGVTLAIR
jgi:uncharacterized protein (TIGR03437 family)